MVCIGVPFGFDPAVFVPVATGDDSELVEPTAQPVYPQLTTYPDVPVIENVAYGAEPGQALDTCFPTDAGISDEATAARPVIVVIHGGSWMRGDWSAMVDDSAAVQLVQFQPAVPA